MVAIYKPNQDPDLMGSELANKVMKEENAANPHLWSDIEHMQQIYDLPDPAYYLVSMGVCIRDHRIRWINSMMDKNSFRIPITNLKIMLIPQFHPVPFCLIVILFSFSLLLFHNPNPKT
jgi:hypothetical protein